MKSADPPVANKMGAPSSDLSRKFYDRVKTSITNHVNSHKNYEPATPSTPPGKPVKCKTITFHHAGYDPELHNTIMFRLEGSRFYHGGVRASTVWMILWALLDTDTLLKLRFAHERGGPFLTVIPQTTCFIHSDYYIHSPNPDNPEDIFYQFPLVPSFECMEIAKPPPSFWVLHGDRSLLKTSSCLEKIKHPTGLELPILCNRAVLARDKCCVVSRIRTSVCRCDRAYLIPYNRRGVWTDSNLAIYMGDRAFQRPISNIIHPMNGITLRFDLHEAYNKGEFVFVPVGERWVAHFFDPTTLLGRQFDQKPVVLSREIPKIFYMVRIAIAAFELAKDFLEQGEEPAEDADNSAKLPIIREDSGV
jgi:hypothetical protein